MKKYIILVGLIIIVIAIFSSQTYEQQTVVPTLKQILANKPFEEQLKVFEFTYWGRTISVEESGYYYFLEFIIRKGSHFCGYGLAALIFYVLYRKLQLRFSFLLAVVTIFIIACLDEYRQSFIPGRTGIFDDVKIDTAGAIFVIGCFKVIKRLRKNQNKGV